MCGMICTFRSFRIMRLRAFRHLSAFCSIVTQISARLARPVRLVKRTRSALTLQACLRAAAARSALGRQCTAARRIQRYFSLYRRLDGKCLGWLLRVVDLLGIFFVAACWLALWLAESKPSVPSATPLPWLFRGTLAIVTGRSSVLATADVLLKMVSSMRKTSLLDC